MKTTLCNLSAALLCLVLTLVLCSCSINPTKLVGTWQGDGTLRAPSFGPATAPSAPFDRAQSLVLNKDGTGAVTTASGHVPLTWNASDDTLTLSFVQLGSWGMRYECKGNTLTLRTGDDDAVFTKTSE